MLCTRKGVSLYSDPRRGVLKFQPRLRCRCWRWPCCKTLLQKFGDVFLLPDSPPYESLRRFVGMSCKCPFRAYHAPLGKRSQPGGAGFLIPGENRPSVQQSGGGSVTRRHRTVNLLFARPGISSRFSAQTGQLPSRWLTSGSVDTVEGAGASRSNRAAAITWQALT